MDVLSMVKVLLGVTDTSRDELLYLIIDSVTEKALAYCKLQAIPPALKPTIAEMAVRSYENMTGGNVSSVKRGDVTVTYSAKCAVGDILESYKIPLNAFRRAKRRE